MSASTLYLPGARVLLLPNKGPATVLPLSALPPAPSGCGRWVPVQTASCRSGLHTKSISDRESVVGHFKHNFSQAGLP